MKEIAAIIVALAIMSGLSSAAQGAASDTGTAAAASTAPASASRIYVVSGKVYVAQGKNPAHLVNKNEAIDSDTLIRTGDKSAALLRFEDGQVVTMQANSTFQVREYHYDAKKIEKSKIVFSMLKGGMRFITGLIGQQRKQAFRLLTPHTTIGIRGTDFMVATVGNSMYSQVLTGNIGMMNAAGTAVVGAGQSAVVSTPGALASLVSASAIPAGTFSNLLSIPVQPSAIPSLSSAPPSAAPAPSAVSVAAPPPPPVAPPAAVAGAAATGVGAVLGVAKGALPSGGSEKKQKPAQPAKPAVPKTPVAVVPQKPAEPATPADEKEVSAVSKSGKSLTGKIGTLGYGGEFNKGITDSVGVRVGFNTYRYGYNANSSAVNYHFKMQLQTASALIDWYPFAGGFRTSAGLFYNNNKVDLSAKPTGGTYTINGVSYSTTQIASMRATLTFSPVASYLGIGWGNPVAKNKGWGLVTDLGILFQGQPTVNLVVTCAAACPAQLQSDATAENTKLQKDLSHFKYWPVISIGVSYQW